MTTELSPAIVEALSIGNLPDVQWKPQDDLCDCVYQRIGMWTNPYLAVTKEVRFCCIWAKIEEMFPGYAREVPAYWDINREEWVTEPAPWNGEEDMPVSIWHRQLARKLGISVSQAREMNLPTPKGQPIKPKSTIFLKWSGEWIPVELAH